VGIGHLKSWNKRRLPWIVVAGAVVLAPPAAVYADYRGAVRQANGIAQKNALVMARMRFRGGEYRPRLTRAQTSLSFHPAPPSSPYAGDPNAVHVRVGWRWDPFAHLIGGPYPINAYATATVLPTADGRWMVLLVE
jgi:hypothetical protein